MLLFNLFLISIFSLLQISCNGQSTKNNISVLSLLSLSGATAEPSLEDKFQSVQSTTYYRKDGNLQFQDIVIEYKLKTTKEDSESIVGYMGNPNEISYNSKTGMITGQITQIEDSFNNNSIVFSYSDYTKKFKFYLTLKKEGKIISIREITSTPPNAPTIPPNSITLPNVSYETERSISYSGGIPTEYQIIRVKFQADSDLSAFKRLDAYLGRPNIISLAADNFNVINYIKVSSYDKYAGYFFFSSGELYAPYKIIVVGSTNDAKGNRSIDTVPPPPPPSPCAGSLTAPTTIGNCATHCLVVNLVGNQMEYIAKTSVDTSTEEYLYLDSSSSTVSGGSGPVGLEYIEHFSPIGIGAYQTNLSTFDVTSYNNACVVLSSYLVREGPGGFKDSYLTTKVIVP
ncbi:hypothetical protein ND856_15655 [Leptospira bandrabouensis]|uniref:hypothetical protein n=1 Tax=Leptospira bandrabouensis TaxID=2484903 RepID=UPI00223CA3A0|nr:hypothetical protein [Leptospira bandrabouensis]MCW7458524.1 hypothetical protein [Leptospira bandrabouensis]MCW7478729.1 hypothetical protein [Leptospira bandrabouensis]MCW7486607.1 hypothetical protein [Leptospira bandrabouensis]